MKTNQCVWYVVKQSFRPRKVGGGASPFEFTQGCLVSVPEHEEFWNYGRSGPPRYEPSVCYGPTGLAIDTDGTFRELGGLECCLWGPYSEETVGNGLYYVRGQVGPHTRDVNLYRAGAHIRLTRNDGIVNNLVQTSLFDALLGKACVLFSSDGSLSLAAVLKPEEYLVQ